MQGINFMVCHLNVISIKKKIFSGEIKKIDINTINGILNIYSGHAPLLTIIQMGILCILTVKYKKIYMYVSDGILEVQPTVINVLPDVAILGNDLNYNKLLNQKEKIQYQILNQKNNDLKKQLNIIMLKLKIIQLINE